MGRLPLSQDSSQLSSTSVSIITSHGSSLIDLRDRANIRLGRTTEQRAELTVRPQTATAKRTAASPSSIAIHIEETEASLVMEGGSLILEPGSPEEEAWKALDA